MKSNMALADYGNGALTDTATCLMWQTEDDGVERDQSEDDRRPRHGFL